MDALINNYISSRKYTFLHVEPKYRLVFELSVSNSPVEQSLGVLESGIKVI